MFVVIHVPSPVYRTKTLETLKKDVKYVRSQQERQNMFLTLSRQIFSVTYNNYLSFKSVTTHLK